MATVLGRATELTVKIRKDPIPRIKAAGFEIMGVRERENADYSVR